MQCKGDELSMFEKVEKLGETQNEHEELIKENILPRLGIMEAGHHDTTAKLIAFEAEIKAVRNAQSSLELTVLKDGQQTRDLLNRFVDHYFKTDSKMMESREKAMESKEKVTIRKLTKSEKVSIAFISMLGGGGIAALAPILIHFFSK